jgi:hypothetical protein
MPLFSLGGWFGWDLPRNIAATIPPDALRSGGACAVGGLPGTSCWEDPVGKTDRKLRLVLIASARPRLATEAATRPALQQTVKNRRSVFRPPASGQLSDHHIPPNPQPARTDHGLGLQNAPRCRRNEDPAAGSGGGWEKGASASRPTANAGTDSRVDVMVVVTRYGGRQRCHRQHRSQRNRRRNLVHGKTPLSSHVPANAVALYWQRSAWQLCERRTFEHMVAPRQMRRWILGLGSAAPFAASDHIVSGQPHRQPATRTIIPRPI